MNYYDLIKNNINLEGLQISLFILLFSIPIHFKPNLDLLGYFLFTIITTFLLYPILICYVVTKMKRGIADKFYLIYSNNIFQQIFQVISLIIIIGFHFFIILFDLKIKKINLYILILLLVFLVINIIFNIINLKNNSKSNYFKIILIELFKYIIYFIIIAGLILINGIIFSIFLAFKVL